MLDLNNITLVTIDGKGDNLMALKALKYSTSNIKFGAVKFISPCNLGDDSFYEYVKIDLLSYDDYNNFCINKLNDYITTEYVLIIQDDGFVINSQLWSNDFLNYDYIGAPWDNGHLYFNSQRWSKIHEKFKESGLQYIVGNGGFSLRSKKLLNSIKTVVKHYNNEPEDVFISIFLRKELETNGCIFAPFDVAKSFSCESQNVNGYHLTPAESFGFHGRDTHRKYVDQLNTVSL